MFCAVPPSSDTLIEQEGKHDLRALPLDIAEAFYTFLSEANIRRAPMHL